jgi:hypothetical protein
VNLTFTLTFTTLTLTMETGEIAETLVSNSTLTRLVAREGFSIDIRSESFKSYKM